MKNIYQTKQGKNRFFPYIIPIAFPLIFPLSFGVFIALGHMVPPALRPVFAVLLVVSLILIVGLQFLAIMWTLAWWIWAMIKAIGKSIIKMGNWLMQRLTSQPKQLYDQPPQSYEEGYHPEQAYYQPSSQPGQKQPYDQPSPQAEQAQSYCHPAEQVQ